MFKIYSLPTRLLFAVLLVASGCKDSDKSFDVLEDGVLVRMRENQQGGKLLRVKVVADNILRITASATDSFTTKPGLMIVDQKRQTPAFKLVESNGFVAILTNSIHAKISLANGEISFADTTGKPLLRETTGGRRFSPSTTVSGKYVINEVFESDADEAFYGLGGHQNGQMNYKGDDVDLVQHNIVDVVPFLYSSRNYGILWDNYSITRFGDPREYQPLSSLKLYSRDGKEGGLTATYHAKGKIVKSAVEKTIDFEYLETPQVDSFPKDVASSGKVVWEGSFSSDKEGDHKFLVYASGYFKVWIDGKLLLDKWRQGWNPWSNKFKVPVKKGERHTIKVEWNPDGGAYLAVKHLDPYPEQDQNKLSLQSEVASEIDYYFIHGANADEVISGYRTLTGKAPIVPKWALGYWQSRERYRTQAEVIDIVKEYRKRGIPLDNIVLDWQYWEDPKWGSHEFDATRFPDPKGMVNTLHNELHANIMISIWPKFNTGTANYDEMKSKGFLFTRNVEKKRKDWVGPGYESTFYDPFNAEAGKLFWKQIDKNLNSIGIDAWWLDATEPDMHSNLSIEERKKNMSPTALGPGEEYFNAYSLVNAKGVYEGQRKSSPDKRVFILTRSSYAGQQRYGAATWSGDIVSRWSDFQDQIAAGVNFSLSGIPYWTMDIGGFAVEKRFERAQGADLDEWRELNTRWFQFGAFCPIFRSHGQYPYREIFNIAPPDHIAYKSMVEYTKLRYRLMPYLYSLAGACYWNDYTMMRGLVMDFNDDSRVRNIADQYMLGPSILVNPVYEHHATSRKVYLPASSGWYEWESGKYLKGGQTITAEAPLYKIPLYVKAGSIIPFGPELQYTSEKHADPITLFVYTGADAKLSLYEDEGVNYNYEKGSYSRIPMRYEEDSKTLTIEPREGSYNGLLEERTFQIVWVKTDHPVGVGSTTHSAQVVRYDGKSLTITMN